MPKSKAFKITDDFQLQKEIAKRFKQFRESIDKTQSRLADELNVQQNIFADIEKGLILPGIDLLHYFNKNYHLNCNWLLSGEGAMTAAASIITSYISIDDPRRTRYEELIDLIQIPAIERIILGRLEELKLIAVDEIKEFKKKKGEVSG